ncbi:hypothetical protein BDB00DRAFT_579378 [Zychaea mexicana]|uniref:uncharacterized protein n=1 Tax=Zychaea mexicana TaxID=64656 RepID=UPI0022FE4EB8|nr:uncharacterized protein BDB00DRAFT_579378 [Zychaea mexicana]KAI9489912.1 hypothetical protein BDB00DRAFT_579378 [Zychaea mexicana]
MNSQRQNSWAPLKKNLGKRPTSTRPLPLSQGSYGPSSSSAANESNFQNPQDEIMRKHSEEYNTRQAMKAAMLHANTTSYGFYIPKTSKYDNLIIPAIPRLQQQHQQ